jgi:hypothetical protein
MMFVGLFFAIAMVDGLVLLATWIVRGSKGETGSGSQVLAAQTPRH